MRVVLIGKKYIIKDVLPKDIIEDYWIIDKNRVPEKRLINIKANNGNYEAISNNYSRIINPKNLEIQEDKLVVSETNNSVLQSTILMENSMYPIMFNDSEEIFILYCLPDFENNFTHIDFFGMQKITIGYDDSNSIVYKNPLINDFHAEIIRLNKKWTIENHDSKYGIFVNNFPVYDNVKDVFSGDTIFIMGLELVMIKDSLYINNPQNNVTLSDPKFTLSKVKNSEVKNEDNEENETFEVQENKVIDYYTRSPRMIPPIEKKSVIIDEPPELRDEEERPMLLALGSSLAMGIMMFTILMSTINGMIKGTATAFESTMGIISSLAMLVAMLVIPILDVKWNRKNKEKYEIKRQKRYKRYLSNKKTLVNQIKEEQKEILYENYLSADECAEIISTNSPRLWERKREDEDFLTVRIGVGEVPLKIDIEYPREKFSMVDDNLVEALNDFIENTKNINKAPVTISLVKRRILAIVSKNDRLADKYIKNIILQLVTFQSCEDLKLVFLLNKQKSKDWQYVKMLPHIWDDTKQIRFFADNYDDMNEISKYLTEKLSDRIDEKSNMENVTFQPRYLIITDDYKLIANLGIITKLSEVTDDLGFSLMCITDDIYSLPSSCETFIEIKNEDEGMFYKNEKDSIKQIQIKIDPLIIVFFEKIDQKLANIPIKIEKGTTELPMDYTFLEMYEAGNIEQLDILGRWKRNDSTLSLKAPIGIDNNGMIISLDAHEKFHGPHGLIAGSTGSGKSEFIITYVLSLAVNYHPDDVTFLLIDYKGGGLAGAFQKKNIKLPHLVGIITNIDKTGLNRSLTSIQSELRRRQVIFNEARNMVNTGTIDIYKYQKLYHDGVVKEPVSHLFIICDEFAELKQQQPDFMDELVSVSRIGRSLGVHLILATQKPSGIVNDQIRSNSKFRVCLKVQDVSDSQDIIARPDAAYLKNPGQFYLKVGQNEYFVLGQSGWAGASYISSNVPVKKTDTSVEFISNIGLTIKKVDDTIHQSYSNNEEQLTSILKNIYDIAKNEKITTNNLWLESIPAEIYLKDLRKKYNIKTRKNNIEIVVGEYDDPTNQKQGIVKLNLSQRDNIVIFGNAESGKETLLSTIIYDMITTYTVDQIQTYILDFGTEALKIFKQSSYVGDVIFSGENEKIETFFDMIQKIIKTRKQILSNCNGDYNLYIAKGNKMPIIIIMINNYETFCENYGEKYDDLILTLTREGTRCGIVFVITASSVGTMRYRLASNFKKRICLQLNNEDDYYNIFDNVKNKRPAHIFGRGLVEIEKEIFEFQTAKTCEPERYNEYVKEIIEETNQKSDERAIAVPTLPKKIELQDMEEYLTDISKVPIGLIKKDLSVCTYDFTKMFMTIITSKNIENLTKFTSYIFEEIKRLKNVKLNILNIEKTKNDNKETAYKNFINEIEKDIDNQSEVFTVCAITGIEKMIQEGILNDFEFSELLKKAKENGKHSFIIIDKVEYLEGHSYDEWYSNFVKANSGIWIGNGINNQVIMSPNFNERNIENNCGNSFGYIVDEGVTTFIKLIGIEEERDENE